MRKIVYPVMVLLLATILGACGNTNQSSSTKTSSANQEKIYTTKITKTSTDSGDWVVEGTTSAPNNAKIMVTPSDPDDTFRGANRAGTLDDTWVTVHQGKFKVDISGIGYVHDAQYAVGKIAKVYVFAIANYNKKWSDNMDIPKKILTKVQNKISPTELKYDQGMVDYLTNLDSSSSESDVDMADDSSDSSDDVASPTYDATEGENNAQTHSYGEFVKSDDWLGKSYHISKAKVLQADEDKDGTTLLVYTDDNPSHLFMVLYQDKTAAVEDDYVDIEGVFLKRQTYDTQIGGSNTVPALVTRKITVTGSDTAE